LKTNFIHFLILSIILCLPHLLRGQTEPRVRKIKIQGNETFSDKKIKDQFSTKASTWIGRKFLGQEASYYTQDVDQLFQKELKHYYYSEGFVHLQILPTITTLNKRNTKIRITLRMQEGAPVIINKLKFESRDTLWRQQLLQYSRQPKTEITALPGIRFRDDLIWNDRNVVNQQMVDHGYAYAVVEPQINADSTNNTASLTWQLNPGPLNHFGAITISGAEYTPERLIYKQLTIKKGDPYSRQALNTSQQQIYQLGTFRIASLQAQLNDAQTDTIPIHIAITEAPRHSVKFGLGYGREDYVRAFVDYQVLNFTGGARRLNLYAKHSHIEPYRFEATVTQPAAFSPNSTLALKTAIQKTDEPGYELFSSSADLSILQKINKSLSATFDLFYETINLDTTSLALIEDLDILDNYSKNGFSATLLFNNTHPRFDPSSGWMVTILPKYNTTLLNSEYPFLKLQSEVKHYQQIFDPVILAMRLKAGTIKPIGDNSTIPVEERFFAGGSRSVRGWARQELGPVDDSDTPTGGNSTVEFSIEPRIKIYGPLSMVIFWDGGNVWSETNAINLSDLRYAMGSGIRFSTPIGPVGIDLARPVWDETKTWQLHFNIGHAF
jgi:outer membrane protein insertion porin family